MYANEPGARGGTALAALVLVLVFAASLFVTNPLGNFPLNDDWSYGQAVQNLAEHGEYRLAGWTSMPLLTQVFWGALFALPAGFSFTALRFSTLSLSLAALLLLLALGRLAGERRFALLLFGPLLVFANPVYLNLSHTFMTDVPFIAFTLASLVLLVAGAERRNNLLLAAGVVLAVLATLLRQTGMLIPIAFGIGYLTSRWTNRRRILLAVGFFALTGVAFVGYTRWLAATGRLPSDYNTQAAQTLALAASGLPAVGRQLVDSLLVTFTYLGIFTLPLGLLFLPRAPKKRLLLFLVIAAALLGLERLLHVGFAGNVLSDRGTGPFTLAGTDRFAPFTGARLSLAAFGLLALAGGTMLLELLARTIANVRSSWVTATCLSFAGLCFVSLSLVRQLDRYMLVYLPLLAVPALAELRRTPAAKGAVVAAFAAVLVYAAFSVSAVHDYLAWNRVRWQAARHLMSDLAVPPGRVDGGFEFDGLYNFSEAGPRGPSRWWVQDPEYVIAFDSLPGHDVLARYPVGAWLPAGVKRIYLLERAAMDIQPE